MAWVHACFFAPWGLTGKRTKGAPPKAMFGLGIHIPICIPDALNQQPATFKTATGCIVCYPSFALLFQFSPPLYCQSLGRHFTETLP